MRRVLMLLLIAGIPSFNALGDSIKVGSTVYKDVYVIKTSSGYYISMPADGTVLNAPLSDVDASSVSITPDREARQALYERWRQQNQKRKFAAASSDAAGAKAAPPTAAPSPPPPSPSGKAGNDDLSLKDSSSISVKRAEPPYDPEAEEVEREARQRNMMIDEQRRNREVAKQEKLNARKLITAPSTQNGNAGLGGAGLNNYGGYGR